MSDMIDHCVAAVICELGKRPGSREKWPDGTILVHGGVILNTIVRLTIEAMRKPTREMIDAGYTSDAFRLADIVPPRADYRPQEVWRAMVDAALGKAKPGR